jgi:hypothetical protein
MDNRIKKEIQRIIPLILFIRIIMGLASSPLSPTYERNYLAQRFHKLLTLYSTENKRRFEPSVRLSGDEAL